jgi:stage II sporulation protein D
MCIHSRPFRFIALLVLLASAPTSAQSLDEVSVRLLDKAQPRVVSIAGHGAPVRLFAGGFTNEIARIVPGDMASLSRSNDQVYLNLGQSGIFATSIRIEPAAGGQIAVALGNGGSPSDVRHYEGRIFISPDETDGLLRLINEVSIDDYVAAVVAAEYGFDDLEGAKAMAVIIRTYTMAVMNKYGSEYDHVDHALSQVYRGTEGITPTIREAVRQTQGEVLSYEGELIEAVYFAASGGHTADNDAVWLAEAAPYLRGKPDPYGGSAPQSTWTFRVSRDRLLGALSATYGAVTGFVIDKRGKDDRVTSIELLKASGRHKTIGGNEFRMLILEHFGDATLRSTLFTADRDGDEYVFEGRGSGHGVGLSQWGAHELAQRNSSYREILEFYYTDVYLQRLDDLTNAEPLPAAASSTDPPDAPVSSAPKSGRIGW